jgi:predicted CxxxxCH...CXXCH cytochrome family protein
VNNAQYGGNFACIDCHATTVSSNLAIGNRAKHVNKFVDYSGRMAGKTKNCANFYCHSNGKGAPSNPSTWAVATPIGCDGCHGAGNGTGAPVVANDSHPKHAPTAAQCFRCHRLTASESTPGTLVTGTVDHLDMTIDARLANIKRGYTNYSGAYNMGTKQCSATYCHGGSVTTPAWGVGSTNCNSCHKAKPNGLSAAHAFHIMSTSTNYNYSNAAANASTTGTNFTCASCHGNTLANHADAPVQQTPASDATIFFGFSSAGRSPNYAGSRTGASTADGSGFYWTAGTAGACNATYCHSNGKGGNGLVAINWASSQLNQCNVCHANEASTAASWGSGAHFKHITSNYFKGATGIRCKDCHAPTISNSDNRTLADKSKHVNKMVNYSGQYAGKNKNCSNIYCHSNGKGSYSNVAWTGTNSAGCNFCHGSGTAPLSSTSAHTPHLADGATCSMCHNSTTNNNTTITGSAHIDGTVSFLAGGSFGSATPKAVSFTPGAGGTCSNISCHSPVAAPGPYPANTVTWGVKATCGTCHPKSGLSAGHQVHIGFLNLSSSTMTYFYNMTSNRSPDANDTVRKYGFGCANCHPMTTASHIDGSIEVDMTAKSGGVRVAGVGTLRFLNSTSAGANAPVYSGGKQCNNIFCHSNASRVAAELVYRQTPVWGGSFTGDRCAGCHDNQPNTGAHAAHSVGNHTTNNATQGNILPPTVMYDGNIYNGKSGKVAISNRPNSNTAHGNPNNSTTIGCYLCHNLTVTSKANDQNYKCYYCHVSGNYGATPKGNAAINSLKYHVDGTREIQFAQVFVKSKAQVRNESFKFYSGVWQRNTYKSYSTLSYDTAKVRLDLGTTYTFSTPMNSSCSNVVCHNGKSPKWNLADWNDPNKCMDCHNQL